MTTMEMKVNSLVRFITARNDAEKNSALAELTRLTSDESCRKEDTNTKIRRILLEIGVPDALHGHGLLIKAVELVVENPSLIHVLTKGLYPDVAKAFSTTPYRAERSMRHAIEAAWCRADAGILQKFFGSSVSPLKGKPTLGEFIARIANVVRDGEG